VLEIAVRLHCSSAVTRVRIMTVLYTLVVVSIRRAYALPLRIYIIYMYMISNRRVGERERESDYYWYYLCVYAYFQIFFFRHSPRGVWRQTRTEDNATRRVRPASRVRGGIRILWGSAETPVTEKYNNIYACTW